MNFDKSFALIEALRKESIGVPTLNRASGAYEFHEHSPKVVAVLKLIRAAHGLKELARKTGQGDKWIFCLTAARIAAIQDSK